METEDGLQICHVKNTGRCRELLVPGAAVYLEKAANSARKTAYDLIAVEKGALLINMDAQAPNRVFQEWAAQGHFLPDLKSIQPEYHYGESRLDFALTTEAGLHLVEVKGVTLEENGVVRFPDAPTERGVKHIHELQRAVREGLGATLFFVIQMHGVDRFSPNDATHPAFGAALREAAAWGVQVYAYDCLVTPDSLTIGVGLSMDAFAVAVCQGLCMPKLNLRYAAVIALFFGGFQALMPYAGWLLGAQFAGYIQHLDHWLAFFLLAFIGGKMVCESLKGEAEETACAVSVTLDYKQLLLMAVATSIDALAVGVTFAFLNVDILPAVTVIGCTTFVISLAGVVIGTCFGARRQCWAEIAGGVILILLGGKILLEHLGIL